MCFFDELNKCLNEHFLQYELIAVNGNGEKNTCADLRKWADGVDKPLTVVSMSSNQLHEQCMNAGLDISIGDYVYEFDSTEMPYSIDLVWEAYETAMKGNDIVTVCPNKERTSSKLFYSLFNRHSNYSSKLRTDAFRLVSRRVINRAHAISENLPYRKATYAACEMKMAVIEFEGCMSPKETRRFDLATDSLVLYTDFGYRFSIKITLLMGFVAIGLFVYALAEKILGNPIEGWTSLACIITFGFSGLFGILAIVIKYLTLLLRITFRKQKYLVSSIEKI